MRRSFLSLATAAAASAGKGIATAGTASGGELSTADGAAAKSGYVIADAPPKDFAPSASEAPELLEAYVEPRPFISPRRVQLFTVSTAVGATAVALIYFLLSKSISASAEEEDLHIAAIAAKNREAVSEREHLFPQFTAPSSYDELQAKMAMHERELQRQEEQIYSATSMLNTEVVYHAKMWWNRCLTNVQIAVNRLVIALERRRQQSVRTNIEATLRYHGYELVSLKEKQ